MKDRRGRELHEKFQGHQFFIIDFPTGVLNVDPEPGGSLSRLKDLVLDGRNTHTFVHTQDRVKISLRK